MGMCAYLVDIIFKEAAELYMRKKKDEIFNPEIPISENMSFIQIVTKC